MSATEHTRIVKKDEGSAGKAVQRADNALVAGTAADGYVIETDANVPKRIGLWVAFLVFGVFGLWAAFMPLEEAAHGIGAVTVKSYKKVVQHFEGGIVNEIRVQNGDVVKAGDVLVVMDNTQPLAQMGIANTQLTAILAQEARLIAERDNLPAVIYPPSLDPNDPLAKAEINGQNQIFNARKTTYEGEIAVLEQRVGQLHSTIVGLKALQESKEQLAASYTEELTDVHALLKEGFSDKLRLRELERNLALLKGEAAELTSNIAATEIKIGETQLEILQLKNRFQSEVVTELATVQTNRQDVQERYTALSDVVMRTDVRATDSGIVNGMQVHTEGAVIAPGTVIAEIVPETDDMIVEAQISPLDRDRIAMGQDAKVNISAFNSRIVPTLYGKVIGLSADSFADERTGMTYYTARVELNADSLGELQGQVLVPGMPAEVFITTGSRTFLQYLMKPLSDSLARAIIED